MEEGKEEGPPIWEGPIQETSKDILNQRSEHTSQGSQRRISRVMLDTEMQNEHELEAVNASRDSSQFQRPNLRSASPVVYARNNSQVSCFCGYKRFYRSLFLTSS